VIALIISVSESVWLGAAGAVGAVAAGARGCVGLVSLGPRPGGSARPACAFAAALALTAGVERTAGVVACGGTVFAVCPECGLTGAGLTFGFGSARFGNGSTGDLNAPYLPVAG
jgi:hypothetical protein